jgi:hypothetical protein
LLLQPTDDEDIVPTLLVEEVEDEPYRPRLKRRLPLWGRIILVVLVACWVTVFAIGALLNPYEEDGTPKLMGTHRGPPLNLPDCTFKEITGLPCPSCGMTTSFSLLIHGDPWNSLRANFAGTALATLGLLYIPWALVSASRGKFLFMQSLELTLFRLSVGFLVLLFGRWGIALAMAFAQSSG